MTVYLRLRGLIGFGHRANAFMDFIMNRLRERVSTDKRTFDLDLGHRH